MLKLTLYINSYTEAQLMQQGHSCLLTTLSILLVYIFLLCSFCRTGRYESIKSSVGGGIIFCCNDNSSSGCHSYNLMEEHLKKKANVAVS